MCGKIKDNDPPGLQYVSLLMLVFKGTNIIFTSFYLYSIQYNCNLYHVLIIQSQCNVHYSTGIKQNKLDPSSKL